mmetsp:Transcript_115287/g.366540  ORF Transcript_115287/g.366540 Transcript_115287/m.366540 type:complete len:187 (+) Transcript_115287:269-829(+)
MANGRWDPKEDSGWTQAVIPGAEHMGFCMFFDSGICSAGRECRFFLRVPSTTDCEALDVATGIFGRGLYARHRGDFGGVGSFNSECRTVFVGDRRLDRAHPSNAVQKVEQAIRENFGSWGEAVEVRVISSMPRARRRCRLGFSPSEALVAAASAVAEEAAEAIAKAEVAAAVGEAARRMNSVLVFD